MPTPTMNEIKMKEGDFIVSKTDTKGRITYANKIFMHMCGYSENELLGAPHNIIRHPDMPRCVFKLLWDTIQGGKEIFAYVKNLCKDGSFYWVFANVTASYDEAGKIIGYYSVRRKPKESALEILEPIYEKLLELEKQGGMDASLKYLTDFLKNEGISYDELIATLQK